MAGVGRFVTSQDEAYPAPMQAFEAAISIPGTSGAADSWRHEASPLMASPTILLVDDDIEFLTSVSKLLGYFGYVVAGASNSEAAMKYVAHAGNRFDLIVTDLAMPKIDGLAFMTAARTAFPNIPVIVVTGHADRYATDEALRLGALACLAKPLNTQELVNTIERALRSSASKTIRPIPPALGAGSQRGSPAALS